MAIHPRYADAILDGSKQVEFRKRPLAADVSFVVIYATAPVKRIVGEFVVDHTIVATPTELWADVGNVGAIDAESFAAYYEGAATAAAIVVGGARRYPRPVALAELPSEPAIPQSFTYMSTEDLEQIRRTANADMRSLLARVTDGLAALVRAALPSRADAEVVVLPVAAESQREQVAARQ